MFEPNYITPLFAFDDWLNVVFFVVVALIWILGHLFGREQEAPRPQRRRAPQAGGGRPGRSPADEIDRFLREVANRRKLGHEGAPEVEVLRPQPPRRQGGASRLAPVSNRGGEPSRAESRSTQPRPAVEEPMVEQLAEERVREPLGSSVAEHVRTHLGVLDARPESAASPSAHQLAAGLGEISEVTGPATRSRAGATGSLINLLASGVGLRQAIVMTEVFGPPRAQRPLRR